MLREILSAEYIQTRRLVASWQSRSTKGNSLLFVASPKNHLQYSTLAFQQWSEALTIPLLNKKSLYTSATKLPAKPIHLLSLCIGVTFRSLFTNLCCFYHPVCCMRTRSHDHSSSMSTLVVCQQQICCQSRYVLPQQQSQRKI